MSSSLNKPAIRVLWRYAYAAHVVLVALAGGCTCHKGVALQGDWSVALNHVPWEEDCHGGCGAPLVHPGAAPPAPELVPHAAPVHRFQAVPTSPVVSPRPPEVGPAPHVDASIGAPNVSASDSLVPPPDSSTSITESESTENVLRLKIPQQTPSSWTFNGAPSRAPQRTADTRRRLNDGWQPTRR